MWTYEDISIHPFIHLSLSLSFYPSTNLYKIPWPSYGCFNVRSNKIESTVYSFLVESLRENPIDLRSMSVYEVT